MSLSTRELGDLPDAPELEKVCQSLAMLDAIMSPEWQYRYFSFNSKWDQTRNERMASMRNGSGDEYFLLFSESGAILKGFDHESEMSPWAQSTIAVWPGVLDHVPQQFSGFLNEPAFALEATTFCIWRSPSDTAWQVGPVSFPEGDDPDGSENLLWLLDGNPSGYVRFANEYFEKSVNASAVTRVFSHEPLTSELVALLNGDLTLADVLADALEIGYPHHAT